MYHSSILKHLNKSSLILFVLLLDFTDKTFKEISTTSAWSQFWDKPAYSIF